MSTSSSLLTPTDLSPARSFDNKLNSTYEFGPAVPHLSQPSLLEPSSPNRSQDILRSSDSPPYRRSSYHQNSHQSASNTFPFFEPFSERSTPAQSFYSSPQQPRRSDPTRGSQLLRQQQQFPTPSEWLRTQEEPTLESRSSLGIENGLRSHTSYQYSNQGQNQSHSAHEVSPHPTIRAQLSLICHYKLAHQFPLSVAPIVLASLPCLCCPYHQIV